MELEKKYSYRLTPHERCLNRDCPVHGDAEGQRRHKLAAAHAEIKAHDEPWWTDYGRTTCPVYGAAARAIDPEGKVVVDGRPAPS